MSTFVDRHRFDFNFNNGGAGSFGDIFWRSDDFGFNVVWLMNNNVANTITALPAVTPDWKIKGAGDFDQAGQGDADILWQNDNGSLAIWQMNDNAIVNIVALPNVGPTWKVVGDNDFNGNAANDILFRNDSGAVAMWTFTAANAAPAVFSTLQNPGPTWHVVGTGDTNNDQLAGILWQNDSGLLAIWENATFGANTFVFNTAAALPSVDATWHVKGMGDMNGNGPADIVFQHDSGAVVIWEMGGAQGTTVISTNLASANPGSGWHIVGIRDMNNDAKADILFQHDTGTAAVWENYTSGGGSATFTILPIQPNPNPDGPFWDLY